MFLFTYSPTTFLLQGLAVSQVVILSILCHHPSCPDLAQLCVVGGVFEGDKLQFNSSQQYQLVMLWTPASTQVLFSLFP